MERGVIKCPVPVMLEAKVLPFILAFWCIMASLIQIYFNILVPNPFLVLADAYYIPLVCYLSRKSVVKTLFFNCLSVRSFVRPPPSVVDTACFNLDYCMDPKGNVWGYPILLKATCLGI